MNRDNQYPPRRFRNVEQRFRDLRQERDQYRDQDFREWEREQEHNFRHWEPDLERGFRNRGYPEPHPRMRGRNLSEEDFDRRNWRPVNRMEGPGQRMERPGHRMEQPGQFEEREMWRPEHTGRIGHMEQYAHLNRLVGGGSFGSDYRRMMKAMDDYWQGGMDEQPDYGSYYPERGSGFRPMASNEQRNMRRQNEYGQEAWNKASHRKNNPGRR